MYIVRRTFRGPHGPVAVGSIIEPTDIRMFKYHLQEKHIVEVTEHNLERYATLFKDRFCIDLKAIYVANTTKSNEPEGEPEGEPEEPAKVVAAKPVVKSVVSNK